jgi:hypothetical protein
VSDRLRTVVAKLFGLYIRSTFRNAKVEVVPGLECADLSALGSLRLVGAPERDGLHFWRGGVEPPRKKAVTGHRTPN